MPTPIRWTCPTELTPEEARVTQALRRIGKFYVFLREVRAELFDEAFQAELAAAYQPRGTAPVPPAQLAMVTLLQAYDQVGDAEAVVTAQLDPRWQLVLGCLGANKAPFSQGVLVKFRARLITHDLDRKLLERTVDLAKRTGRFGWQKLQAALDSSPLRGAGRVEDTWNLIGRAMAAVVTCAATALERPRAQVVADAGLTLVGRSSLKAALDIDWDDPAAQAAALDRLLTEVDRLGSGSRRSRRQRARRRRCRRRSRPCAGCSPRISTRIPPRASDGFGGASRKIGSPHWVIRRCGMGAKRARARLRGTSAT